MTVIGIALMVIGLIAVIYLVNELSKRSRREMGLPKKKKRIRGKREKP